MIPVTDAVRRRSFPYVNLALILINIAVFLYELSLSAGDLNSFFFDWGAIPVRLIAWWDNPSGTRVPETIFTAMFLHGGWLHLFGNMIFLWVFGDNVEDALGHLGYLVFYFVAGVGAAAMQTYMSQDSVVPMVGASGAIAGVLGAYLIMYPRAIVGIVIPLLFFLGPLPMPAALLIGFWFLLQLLNGLATVGPDTTTGGVAFWAHVGGFVVGVVVALFLRPFLRRLSAYLHA
ncbi:MAG TPA: rhomboid family intramembrane serine protease [Dehalococcoidia bacterium]|nr:rhomboid family intramembrane serine protease [Dehalococcoidia bacterium]